MNFIWKRLKFTWKIWISFGSIWNWHFWNWPEKRCSRTSVKLNPQNVSSTYLTDFTRLFNALNMVLCASNGITDLWISLYLHACIICIYAITWLLCAFYLVVHRHTQRWRQIHLRSRQPTCFSFSKLQNTSINHLN